MNIKLAFLISIVFHAAVMFAVPASLLRSSSSGTIVKRPQPIYINIVYQPMGYRREGKVFSTEQKSYVMRNFPYFQKIKKTRKYETRRFTPIAQPLPETPKPGKQDAVLRNATNESSPSDNYIRLASGSDGDGNGVKFVSDGSGGGFISGSNDNGNGFPNGAGGDGNGFGFGGTGHQPMPQMEPADDLHAKSENCDRALASLFRQNFNREITMQELTGDRMIEKRRGVILLRIVHGSVEVSTVEASGNVLMDEIAKRAAEQVAQRISAIGECKNLKRTVRIPYLFRWRNND